MADAARYEGWVSAFSCSTDFEADLVRDRLDEAGVSAVVLTQRDHAFNLNVGDLSPVYVMVPPDEAEDAAAVLAQNPLTDEELEEAAMSADVMAPDAHNPTDEARLDSGIEEISFEVPDDADEDATDEEEEEEEDFDDDILDDGDDDLDVDDDLDDDDLDLDLDDDDLDLDDDPDLDDGDLDDLGTGDEDDDLY